MRCTYSTLLSMLLACGLASAAAHAQEDPAESTPAGHTTVVWISVDGMRYDYLDRAETPTFDRLFAEGAFSRELVPVFPSLTFPSHVSQATGVLPAQHGIPGNSFFDAATGEFHRYPGSAQLLESEPIWITAERQGVRTAVIDWTVSHAQEGPVTASYFGQGYNARLSDEERLDQLLEVWRNDDHDKPLGLLIGYFVGPDSPGHRHGPESPAMVPVIERADTTLDWFFNEVYSHWNERKGEHDTLYLVVTTDHGMSTVHSLVNINHLLNIDGRRDIRTVTSGNVANVFLDRIEPQSARDRAIAHMEQAASEHDFVQFFRRGTTPEHWGFEHPTRTGDAVLVLDTGYTFSSRPETAVDAVSNYDGPLGMHGYHPETNPEMNGIGVIWKSGDPLGGIDVGRFHSLQIHPTLCAILGIESAPNATADPIDLTRPAPLVPEHSETEMQTEVQTEVQVEVVSP